jgi:carbonic anhydrase
MFHGNAFFNFLSVGLLLSIFTGCASTPAEQPAPSVDVSHYSQDPQESFDRLIAGNQRLVAAQRQGVDLPVELLTARALGQKPYATVVACADSRSAPEILFDTGYSELFVCRVAGNIADTQSRASVEYSVKALGTRLIIVMGHTQCGAVDATIKKLALTTNIVNLIAEIQPGVQMARDENWPKDDLVSRGVVLNAYLQKARLLKYSDMLRAEHDAGRIKILVGMQDLATGNVLWLDNDGLKGPARPDGKVYAAPQADALAKNAIK